MNRGGIRATSPGTLVRAAEKGYIVGGGGTVVQILQANLHGSDGNSKVLETGEKIEKVVRGQGQLGRLDIVRGEAKVAKRECRSQGARGRGR